MIRKLLVANRGEIAVRAFRAANELGIETVAVHTWEDRNSLHRLKADEAYQLTDPGAPVRAYLDVPRIIEIALQSGADAVYPGYGFLSENPELAEACAEAGLTFVGPPGEVLTLAGSKLRAQRAAAAAGIPVLRQSEAITDPDSARSAAEEIGFPLFVKAAAGGGGRGLRLVTDPAEFDDAVDTAIREAASAFGDPTVFLETAVIRPRHIEVQILADATGETIHLYERDCSVQRRHQKVVEIAPAPALDPDLRDRLCADAVTFARSIGYVNAGTVEFLVDGEGRHVFIEMNPRIQVEHTVTEETTDVDLVQSQLRIAGGASLADLGLSQDRIVQRGAALQCRITTEDPANDFRPDTGRIIAYRQPGGAGIRLDGGGGYAGAEISPYFDSLLVKVTCRGQDFPAAVRRMSRALAEFRIRGVSTNLGYLQAVLDDDEFQAGGVTTSFIDDRPGLLRASGSADRATRLLRFLGDVTVNRPHGPAPTLVDPASKLPPRPTVDPPAGSRQRLAELGPDAFAAELRAQRDVAVTDTTLRDAHQSILATRIRTHDLVLGARHMAHATPELLSLECWGGATFDVAMRFLREDPWERLDRLREAAPNLCLQMLLRGRNTVGYSRYPDTVGEAFVHEAAASGIDVFRVFDAFNNIDQMAPAIRAARDAGALVEGTLCYTGDVLAPGDSPYTLDYYLARAEELVAEGVHVLCVKDMAGLLRAPAAHRLIQTLRERFDQPVHLHTHDTAGGQLATYLAAIDAGVDAVDAAAAPLSGMTSQPSIAALVAATDHSGRPTGLSLDAIGRLEPYWESVRRTYRPFEAGLNAPTGSVYRHEIPGGQLSNLRTQAIALGLGDRFEEIEELYAACDDVLGGLVKVTPSSKVVGDLALHLVATGTTPQQLAGQPGTVDLPDSVVGFLRGEIGTPPAGWPEPFRTAALEGRRDAAPDEPLEPADAESLAPAAVDEPDGDRRATLSRLLFPGPSADLADHRERYGDTSLLPSRLFLYGLERGEQDVSVSLGRGVRLLVGTDAISEPDERGDRTVVFRLNGQLRPLDVRDRSVAAETEQAEQADPNQPGEIGAPFRGVATVVVAAGDELAAGDTVATIEAMKMESAVRAPVAGVVERLAFTGPRAVDASDLLAVIRPSDG